MKSKLRIILVAIFIIGALESHLFSQTPWDIRNFQSLVNGNSSSNLNQYETIEFRMNIKGWDAVAQDYIQNYPYSQHYRSFFDTSIIDCYGQITTPNNSVINIFGFFDIEPNQSNISCNDALNGDNNPHEDQENSISFSSSNPEYWKVRYTPGEIGQYSYIINIKHLGVTKTITGTFTVAPSVNKGFVFIGENNKRFFQQKNTSGIFYPIGINNAWSLGWKDGDPRVVAGYCYWKRIIDELSNCGGNVLRIWLNMEQTDVGFQPGDLTLFGYNNWINSGSAGCIYWDLRFEYSLENAFRLDEILKYAKEKNVYIQLSILQPNIEDLFWESTPNVQPNLISVWQDNNNVTIPSNNYINICHSSPNRQVNHFGSGIINNPFDFYRTDVIKTQRFLMRYIMARYGHSTNIISWETGNELDYGILTKHTGTNQYVFAFNRFPNPEYQPTVKTKDLSPVDQATSESIFLNRVNIWSKNLVNLAKYYDFHDHIIISGQRVQSRHDYTNWGPYNNGTTTKITEYGNLSLLNSDFGHAHVYPSECPGAENPQASDFGKTDMPTIMHTYLKDFHALNNSTNKPAWIQEFGWMYENCGAVTDAVNLDRNGFYSHGAYWQSIVSGYAGTPLTFDWILFKRFREYNSLQSISNFMNQNLGNVSSSFTSHYADNNSYRAFYRVDLTNSNTIIGWCQNRAFEFHKLVTYHKDYLSSLLAEDKPEIGVLTPVKLPVSETSACDYEVKWFSTVSGLFHSTQVIRSNFNSSSGKFEIELALPEELLNNVYSDGAFIVNRICTLNMNYTINYGNNNANSIDHSTINNYSTLSSALTINYGEDFHIDLASITNKDIIDINFIEYSNNIYTGNFYTVQIPNQGNVTSLSLLSAFRSCLVNGATNNQYDYFLTSANNVISYRVRVFFKNVTNNCSSFDSFFFYFKTANCSATAALKLNGSSQFNTPSTALELKYAEDFTIDGLASIGEVEYRISVVEVDVNANYLSTVEPYRIFSHPCSTVHSFNEIYQSFINKYDGSYLNPPLSNNGVRYYKLKFVAMNAYTNQGCEQWDEMNQFVRIVGCSTTNDFKVNGVDHSTYTLNNPLVLNYGEDMNLDCRLTTAETQYRFSVMEVDVNGNYLWSTEPYKTFTGNCNLSYSFNEVYSTMINKPTGRFLLPGSTGARYYKIKFVSMNTYGDSGCTQWNESNYFVTVPTCSTTSIIKVNGYSGSTFSNPTVLTFGSQISIDCTESTGETQHRICIVPLDDNGDVVTSLIWPSEAYYHVNNNCTEIYDLLKLIPEMTYNPAVDYTKWQYFTTHYNYYRIKLITMNAYSDDGCEQWNEVSEIIKFTFPTTSISFKVNGNSNNCQTIIKECDPVLVNDISILGNSTKYRIDFEKLLNCSTNCTNCVSRSDNITNYTSDPKNVEINGFVIYRTIADITDIDIRALHAAKYGTSLIPTGYYRIRIRGINQSETMSDSKIDIKLYFQNDDCQSPNHQRGGEISQDNPTTDGSNNSNIKDSDSEASQNTDAFLIKPNPVEDILQITSVDKNTKVVTISIYNLNGELVDHYINPVSVIANEYVLDCSNHPAGFYYVQVGYDKGYKVFKIIKL